MARCFAVHSVNGLLKQLVAASSQSLESATSCLQSSGISFPQISFLQRCQLQQCWLHSPATCNIAASSTHSYHGGRDDDSNDSSSSQSAAGGRAAVDDMQDSQQQDDISASSDEDQDTVQLQALQAAIDRASEAVQAGQHAREAAQLPEHVARHAMRDPLGILMSSYGVPLGISLKVNSETLRQRGGPRESDRDAQADKREWQEMLGRDSSSSGGGGSSSRANSSTSTSSSSTSSGEDYHTSLPSTDAQLMRQRLVRAARKLVREAAQQDPGSSSSSSSSSSSGLSVNDVQRGAEVDELGSSTSRGGASAGSSEDAPSSTAAAAASSTMGQTMRDQLTQLLSRVDGGDSWGTTRQSPAEIAQHIADSNRVASGGGRGGGDDGGEGDGGEGDDGGGDDGADEPLTLSPAEERYANQAAVDADIKQLDEIYEVLAKVPWLDDDDVDERELRGIVAVGLLGTLEEVGWELRENLLKLWAGERDVEVLTAGVGEREAAALSAILYHTQQLEGEYGKPTEAGIAAAVTAAGGDASAAGLPLNSTHEQKP